MHKIIYFLTAVVLLSMIAVGAYIWQNEQDKQALLAQLNAPTPTPVVFEVPTSTPESGVTNTSTVSTAASTGSITGSLSFPSEVIPSMEVCAENQLDKEIYCTDEMLEDTQFQNGFGYRLDVPAGNYTVYAKLANDPYKAYYSEFVTCGLSVECPSHEPIVVTVKADQTTSKVDPQDWYNQ